MNLRYQIVLASNSPRRKELLKNAGIKFTTRVKEIPETYPHDIDLYAIASYLAREKGKVYIPELDKNELLITADTVVICDGIIFEKPSDYDEAFKMLSRLSGKTHEVITGVCMTTTEGQTSFDDSTLVEFDQLSSEDIHYYIETYKPFDKAGSYGIQEWIGMIGIKKINGSYFNVVGLPIHKLYKELRQYIINE